MDPNTVEDLLIPGLQDQYILLAASSHDLESLRKLLRAGSANVQDSDTGFTPLHSAIAACAPSSPPSSSRIEIDHDNRPDKISGRELERRNSSSNIQDAASRTVRLLLENGAIWNDVDANNETPGCLARRLGLDDLYGIMVDAGVRAEMLLNRLDEYQMLGDLDDKEEEGEVEGEQEEEREEKSEKEDRKSEEGKVQEGRAEGERQVLAPLPSHDDHNDYPNLTTYLASPLSIQPTRILDPSRNGIMMSWETPLMECSAARLAPRPGLRILNIGHGMGIIDSFFQKTSPSAHHIIEAHPSILAHMRNNNDNNNNNNNNKPPPWSSSPTITIHEGKWQDVCPELIKQGELFDVIYFDTFAEDYKALKEFFSDYVIGLLDDEGRWGFFNGMGADRQICYDVYTKVVEMDLFEAGFDTEWSTVAVPEMNDEEDGGGGEWEGVRRKYWALDEYKLPVCRFLV